MKLKNNLNQGQVVLMVVLTMLVGLTIATGIFLNSLADTQQTTSEENSERAFNAAEAGIEDLISEIGVSGGIGVGETTVNIGEETAKVTTQAISTFEAIVKQNSVATIFLEGASTTKLIVYWTKKDNTEGNTSTCNSSGQDIPAALLIQKWTGNPIQVDYQAYASVTCPTLGENFQAATMVNNSNGYLNSIELTINPVDKFLRIRPIYNKASILVEPIGGILPAQQYQITSTSQAGSGETRAIEVVKTRPNLPEIFDYALFSGDVIVK